MTESVESPSQSPRRIEDDIASAACLSNASVPSECPAREITILAKDFEPTETDVIIGRGKQARTHSGNQRLRMLIEFMIPEYSAAGSNKDEKSYIIKEIVTQIRKSSPDGGFVKFDKSKDRWFEVGDFLAKEKISQTFRDAMGDIYSSSNPYKRKRRSFEKQNSTIMDIIKQRRGTSPTSVVPGNSTPPSPASPPSAVEPGIVPRQGHNHSPASSFAYPSQGLAAEGMGMVFKHLGQIGFARRSLLQYGSNAGAGPSMYQVSGHNYSRVGHMAIHRHNSIPEMANSMSFAMPVFHQHEHSQRVSVEQDRREFMEQERRVSIEQLRRVSLEQARRASMGQLRRSSMPSSYNAAYVNEIVKRQKGVAHNAATARRSSVPSS